MRKDIPCKVSPCKATGLLLVCLGFILLMAACAAGGPPSSPPPGASAGTLAGPQKSDWERLVEAARSEGTVYVYAGALPQLARTSVQEAFRQKYGINVEFTVGSGGEISQKYKAERAAGLNVVDVMQLGGTSLMNFIRPLNVTVPLKPLLVLSEVVDPGQWREGKLPFADDEEHMFMAVLLANSFYVTNNQAVKEGEINGVTDLLNPKWKGQLVMQDPSVSGNGSDWFAFTYLHILGPARGEAFMRDLVKQQPVVTRDNRQLTEWVARGKYAVGVAPSVSMPIEFIRAGAPISFARVKEPRILSAGGGIFVTFKEVPHPNARKLYLNWLFSKEGSSIYAPAHGYPSTRVDVSTEAFIPALVPAPGDVIPDQEYELKKGELLKVAGDIFGVLRQQ